MANESGVLLIDGANWSSSSDIRAKYITVIFDADAGSLVLNDRHGKEVFRCDNGTNVRTVPVNTFSKIFKGLVVATFTNVVKAYVGVE